MSEWCASGNCVCLCALAIVRLCVCNKETWLIEFYPRRNSKPARTTKLQPKRTDKRKGKREKLIRKQKILLICSRCIHCHKQFSWNFFVISELRERERKMRIYLHHFQWKHTHTNRERIRDIAFPMARISDRDGHFCVQKTHASHGCCVWANCQWLTGIRCTLYARRINVVRLQVSCFVIVK